MVKPAPNLGPGYLQLFWKDREITAPGGGMLRLCTDTETFSSNSASWTKEDTGKWSGQWSHLQAKISWQAAIGGETITCNFSFYANKPITCKRLEFVLPLVPVYHAWRLTDIKDPSELIDPGILGEKHNLDFLDLRTSGFFPWKISGDCNYHLLTTSRRPTFQVASFAHGLPLVQVEALSDISMGAVSTSPESGARELLFIAWPDGDRKGEMPPGEYKITLLIKIGKRPGNWVKELLRQHLDAVGAVTGKILSGPLEVQISPTNRCNQSCTACWCHSPFQRERKEYPSWASRQMDLQFFERLVGEAAASGAHLVSLIGQGDPLLHGEILEMIRMVKKLGMRCRLNTNGLLLSHELNSRLVETGLDRLHVSLWTARPETYARLHPGSDGSELERIEKALADLTRIRAQVHSSLPHLELFHAICRENIDEIDGLIEQAKRVGANSIYIRPMCVIRGRTEHLLPSRGELERLRERLGEASASLEASGRLRINFNEYLEQVSSSGAPEGRYRGHQPDQPCYLGWAYVMVQTDGAMSPCCMGEPLVGPMVSPLDFLPIWTSDAFQEFRIKGLDMKNNAEYFTRRWPCFTECCMDAVNDVMRKKVEAITSASGEFPSFRRVLKRVANATPRLLF